MKYLWVLFVAATALADVVIMQNGSIYENVQAVSTPDSVDITYNVSGEVRDLMLPAGKVYRIEKADYDLEKPAVTTHVSIYQTSKEAPVKPASPVIRGEKQASDYLQSAGSLRLLSIALYAGAGAAVYFTAPPAAIITLAATGMLADIYSAITLRQAGKALSKEQK